MHLDKEALYDNALQLKKAVNILKEENDRLKARLAQSEEESSKKNKLLQEMVGQLANTTIPSQISKSHKETSLVLALKQKVKELEAGNAELMAANFNLKKDIRLTKQNEYEQINKAYEDECKRLRSMLDELLNSKNAGNPVEYVELEEKMLEQRSIITELKNKNKQLSQELASAKNSESQALDRLKENDEKESKSKKYKEKASKYKKEITDYKNQIDDLTKEIDELKLKIDELENINTKREQDTTQTDLVNKLTQEAEKMKKEKEELRKKADIAEKRVIEKEREMREERNKAKEKEEEYVLKSFEDKEKLNQRIVRLERELSVKAKELAENDKKSKEIEVATKAIASARQDIKNIINEPELSYTKILFKIILIKSKKSLDDLKEIIFSEFSPEERISIKELTKIFMKPFIGLSNLDAENLSRFLIEPRDSDSIVYNRYADRVMIEVRIKFDSFLNLLYPKDFIGLLPKIAESSIQKLKPRFRYLKNAVEEITNDQNLMDALKWAQVCHTNCTELNNLEKDYLISIMVDEKNDLKHLDFGKLIEKVENVKLESKDKEITSNEIPHENHQEIKKEIMPEKPIISKESGIKKLPEQISKNEIKNQENIEEKPKVIAAEYKKIGEISKNNNEIQENAEIIEKSSKNEMKNKEIEKPIENIKKSEDSLTNPIKNESPPKKIDVEPQEAEIMPLSHKTKTPPEKLDSDKNSLKMEKLSQKPDSEILDSKSNDKNSPHENEEIEPLESKEKTIKSEEESDKKANENAEKEHPRKKHEEYIQLIKECLEEKQITLPEAIQEKIALGKGEEEGETYEIIMIPDLVYALSPICSDKMGYEKIAGLGDFFRSMVDNNENYILVEDLYEIFGLGKEINEDNDLKSDENAKENEGIEDEEGLLEGIEQLDNDSLGIIAQIIGYLEENKVNFFELFKESMYQQQISIGDQEVSVDVIESKEFYRALAEAKILDGEHQNLSEFLCLDKEYPNIFLVKKIVKLIEYVAMNAENMAGEGVPEDVEENDENDEKDID